MSKCEVGSRDPDPRSIDEPTNRTPTLADVLVTFEQLDEDLPIMDDPPTEPEDLL